MTTGIALMSGGIDSPVALYVMIREMPCTALHMDTRPFVETNERDKVHRMAERIAEVTGQEIQLGHAPFGEIVQQVLWERSTPRYRCVLCKRMMYRVAEAVAREQGADIIITGDNLGQVASQTLRNLMVLEESVELPVVRPLIGLDKEEIITLAKHIGTFELSIAAAPSCQLVPPKPSTAATIAAVHKEEDRLDVAELVRRTIDGLRIEKL